MASRFFGSREDDSSRADIVEQPTGGDGHRTHCWRRSVTVGLAMMLAVAGCGTTAIADLGDLDTLSCLPNDNPVAFPTLPLRAPPAAVTTGIVPHQQINPDIFPEVIADLSGRIFALSDVESRASTIVAGATAIWLSSEANLGRPECVIRDREVGHIHRDGSVHVTLPHGRIPGAEAAGWIERHPWSQTRPGFEAYVMIFSPRDLGEVDVITDLITQGISFVRGD